MTYGQSPPGHRFLPRPYNFSIFVSSLQKSSFLEAKETPTTPHRLADDDVIQEIDLKNLSSRRDALGDL